MSATDRFQTNLDDTKGLMASWLRRTGLTVNSAARVLGVHRHTISNYLYNRKEPEYILRMCMAAYLKGVEPYSEDDRANE